MSLSLTEIQQLMAEFEASSLREFKLDLDETHLYLSKNDSSVAVNPVVAPVTVAPVATDVTINAPLVGTVYLAPKPDAPAFKQVGDTVSVGETVAIIESMKLMTEVKSELAGVITAVNVENESVVGYDDAIFTVEPQ